MFAESVTDFCCIPGLLLESKLTIIFPEAPGAIGVFLGYCGTVQPQLPRASTIIKSSWPVFVKLNSVVTVSPSLMVPKSCSVLSKVIIGPEALDEAFELGTLVVVALVIFFAALSWHAVKVVAIIAKQMINIFFHLYIN